MDSKLRPRTRTAARALLLIAFAVLLAGCSYSTEAAAFSGPATPDVPEKFSVWDCPDARSGPTLADFDQSLWLPIGADPAEVLGLASAPGGRDWGTMTLVAADQAEYRSDRGPVFTFERLTDTFEFEGCVPHLAPLGQG